MLWKAEEIIAQCFKHLALLKSLKEKPEAIILEDNAWLRVWYYLQSHPNYGDVSFAETGGHMQIGGVPVLVPGNYFKIGDSINFEYTRSYFEGVPGFSKINLSGAIKEHIVHQIQEDFSGLALKALYVNYDHQQDTYKVVVRTIGKMTENEWDQLRTVVNVAVDRLAHNQPLKIVYGNPPVLLGQPEFQTILDDEFMKTKVKQAFMVPKKFMK